MKNNKIKIIITLCVIIFLVLICAYVHEDSKDQFLNDTINPNSPNITSQTIGYAKVVDGEIVDFITPEDMETITDQEEESYNEEIN